MTLRTTIKNLFIPRKTQDPVKRPDYGVDMRAIEAWAAQLLAYVNNHGINEITSTGGTVTITNPFGPITNLEATGGGGGGISDLISPDGSITIGSATGPTTSIDVEGWPFPPFSDGLFNVGYGPAVLGNITVGDFNTAMGVSALSSDTSGASNAAFGRVALTALTTGTGNTGVGTSAGIAVTTGTINTFIGDTAGTSVVAGAENTAVGANSGPTGDISFTTSLGYSTTTTTAGGVAIGIDHLGASAASQNQDDFVLGTNRHIMVFSNHTTGSGTASLGTNCPATTLSAPNGWIVVRRNNNVGGTLGYIPFWT